MLLGPSRNSSDTAGTYICFGDGTAPAGNDPHILASSHASSFSQPVRDNPPISWLELRRRTLDPDSIDEFDWRR